VTTLTSAKTKHLPGILNCRHFDAVCFYGNIMVPIPFRAEITQVTWIMRCPNKQNTAHQTREQKKCFKLFYRMFDGLQILSNTTKHDQT